jgi:hypothetical protein
VGVFMRAAAPASTPEWTPAEEARKPEALPESGYRFVEQKHQGAGVVAAARQQ